ncbi:MAG: ABC transporter permease subunit [Dehalococcoidia bacterium]|nr:ABC transporter permease subunit [Dehalococcoidia bacterium]
MSRFAIARKTLRDLRLAVLSVALVVALVATMDIFVYPEYRDQLANFEYPDVFKGLIGEAGSLASPEGFLAAEFFSWIPLLLITVAIIAGTGVLAGEESAGTLDLLLALPVKRWRVMAEKAVGIVLALVAACILGFAGFFLSKPFVGFPLGYGRIAEGMANMLPVTLVFLGLALLLAAALPTRSAAATLTIGAVVAGYFLNTLGAAVESLSNLRRASPFYWGDGSHVLLHGFDWVRAGGLLAVALALFAFALVAFERREIAAGGREWSLRRQLRRRLRARQEPDTGAQPAPLRR